MANLISQTAMPGGSRSKHDQIARGLGYFSLALGFAELLAPRTVARAAGIEGHERLVQGYGLREVATGVAILASHDPTPWIWGRVGGDALDIATVAAASSDGSGSGSKLLALGALLGVAALDAYCAMGLDAEKGGPRTATANYRHRSGFPKGLDAAKGMVADDFEAHHGTIRPPEPAHARMIPPERPQASHQHVRAADQARTAAKT